MIDSARPLDLISMGRVAVDFYAEQIGAPLEAAQTFRMYLGGCAGNIAVGSSRLGLTTAMYSRVGADDLGLFLRTTLEREGVDTSLLRDDPDHLTALVVLGVEPPDRFPLLFYRENCADMQTRIEDADPALFERSKALLVTGTGLSEEPMRRASHAAIALARSRGCAVVLDVDYRPVLWRLTDRGDGETRYVSSETVTRELERILPDVDLLVGTEEEIQIAAGRESLPEAIERLRDTTGATVVLKEGERGCTVYPPAGEPIPQRSSAVRVVNVLGAGDAFMSGFLRGWLRGEELDTCARWANACGALVVSRHGCAPAMPDFEELSLYLEASTSEAALADPRLARRHRQVQLGDASPMQVLAFDHRSQFEESCREAGRGTDCVAEFKLAVLAGFRQAMGTAAVEDPAILVDHAYGRPVLEVSARQSYAVGSPIERAGVFPLEWSGEGSLYAQLLARDPRHFVKVLAHFHPALPAESASHQIRRLEQLVDVCDRLERRLMLEVVTPPDLPRDEATIADAVEILYRHGIRPVWWKLEPAESAGEWRRLTAVLDDNDEHARVVLLGNSAPLEAFARWFEIARSSHHGVGFAVGRTVFWPAWLDFVKGQITTKEVADRVATRYAALAELWQRAAAFAEQPAAAAPRGRSPMNDDPSADGRSA